MDASEERDEALGQLEAKDQLMQELRSQAEHANSLRQQLSERDGQLNDMQLTAQKLRLELESHLASRDAQAQATFRAWPQLHIAC